MIFLGQGVLEDSKIVAWNIVSLKRSKLLLECGTFKWWTWVQFERGYAYMCMRNLVYTYESFRSINPTLANVNPTWLKVTPSAIKIHGEIGLSRTTKIQMKCTHIAIEHLQVRLQLRNVQSPQHIREEMVKSHEVSLTAAYIKRPLV